MNYSLKKVDDVYEDQDGVNYSTPEEWLWIGILGGCGCGSEELHELAYKVLHIFSLPHHERHESIYNNEAMEVIAHWLDSKRLIEHGTGIGGSWLTKEGEEVYGALRAAKSTQESTT